MLAPARPMDGQEMGKVHSTCRKDPGDLVMN